MTMTRHERRLLSLRHSSIVNVPYGEFIDTLDENRWMGEENEKLREQLEGKFRADYYSFNAYNLPIEKEQQKSYAIEKVTKLLEYISNGLKE